MKNLLKYTMGMLLAGLTLTACSPESFEGADPNGLPVISGTDFTMTVDQETNQMTATFPETQGVYPVWIINGTSYSTLNSVGYQNPEAGTYSIELKLGNRNGFSQGSIVKNFTFNETKVDYTPQFNRITGKEWRFANKEAAHLACGPAGTDGAGWWAAAPDEKKDFGLYDDRITFTADNTKGGTYSYDPGADGMTYVNTGTTKWGPSDADFDVAIGAQSAAWAFEVLDWEDADGNVSKQTFIRLAANTVFPYISSDAQYENPLFRVEELTARKLVLVYDAPDRSIAWRFIFTSEEGETVFAGFDPNSDCNMFKNAQSSITFWYADANWSQLPDPALTEGNNNWIINLPTANADQWQTQMVFHTDMTTNASTTYDFSVLLTADKDLKGATVKLTQEDNDDVYFFAERVDLKAGEEYVFWRPEMAGVDIPQVKLVLDFGGCQENTTVEISNIVLKEHACDDGTKLPSVEPGGDAPVFDWNPDAATNLWKAVEDGSAFVSVTPWFANDGWEQIGDPEWSHANGVWQLTIPEGMGGSQWQGQFPINTTLQAVAGKKYNFYVAVEADNDIAGVTIKLTDTADDGNYFCADRHDVTADEEFIYKLEAATLSKDADSPALSLFFDFGGAPAGTHITISKIYFEEAVVLSYDDEANLWKSVDDGSSFISVGQWFANNDWGQIADADWAHDGKKWSLTLPEGMGGSQWQGQFHIDTTIPAKAGEAYNFSCTILADNDCPGVTIKLTDANDDNNFFCADRHDVLADEPYVYTLKGVALGGDAAGLNLFFDFGGSPAGSHVVISDIILEKAGN